MRVIRTGMERQRGRRYRRSDLGPLLEMGLCSIVLSRVGEQWFPKKVSLLTSYIGYIGKSIHAQVDTHARRIFITTRR